MHIDCIGEIEPFEHGVSLRQFVQLAIARLYRDVTTIDPLDMGNIAIEQATFAVFRGPANAVLFVKGDAFLFEDGDGVVLEIGRKARGIECPEFSVAHMQLDLAVLHVDDLHLYYNLASLLWKGTTLEESMGAERYGGFVLYGVLTITINQVVQ